MFQILFFLLFPLFTWSQEKVQVYFQAFENLAKEDKWEEIISRGMEALQEAHGEDEAKICAQLTSTFFYLGNYNQALHYACRCRELSEYFDDPSLFLRALYLESALHRAQGAFAEAVQIGKTALQLYREKNLAQASLLGKIHFNLGAAYADNPLGDLELAMEHYNQAFLCFQIGESDWIRTSIRLGKVYLLQRKFDLTQHIIDQIAPLIQTERIAMQLDYLNAQLLLALDNKDKAFEAAQAGLAKAKTLNAKEDEMRFISLLQKTI